MIDDLDGLDRSIIRTKQFYAAYKNLRRIERLIPRSPVTDAVTTIPAYAGVSGDRRDRVWADPDLALRRAVSRLSPAELALFRIASFRLFFWLEFEDYSRAAHATAPLSAAVRRCDRELRSASGLAASALPMSFAFPLGDHGFAVGHARNALVSAFEGLARACADVLPVKEAIPEIRRQIEQFQKVESALEHIRVGKGYTGFVRMVLADGDGVLPSVDPSTWAYFAIGASITPPCRTAQEFRNRVASWRTAIRRVLERPYPLPVRSSELFEVIAPPRPRGARRRRK